MDILFEIFQLKEPDWTDDFHIALLSVGKITLFLIISLSYHMHTVIGQLKFKAAFVVKLFHNLSPSVL